MTCITRSARRWPRDAAVFITCVLLLGTFASPGVAQEPVADLSLDLLGGITVPIGDAAKVAGTGPLLAIGLNHRISERFSLTTEFHHSEFTQDGLRVVEGTDIGLSRVSLGAELSLGASESNWPASSRIGAGLTRVGTNPALRPPGTDGRSSITKINTDSFTLTGAVQVGRRLGALTPFVRTQVEVHFIGSNLGRLRGLDDSIADSGPIIGIPVHFGVRFSL